MSNKKRDPREAWKGHDVGEILRQAAKGLYDQGVKNARKREIAAQQHVYMTVPVVEVEVEHVRESPPVWRMTTVGACFKEDQQKQQLLVIGGQGRISVMDSNPRFLEAEMRMLIARKFLEYGYVKDWEQARAEAARLKIERRERIIRPKDSELWMGERSRR